MYIMGSTDMKSAEKAIEESGKVRVYEPHCFEDGKIY